MTRLVPSFAFMRWLRWLTCLVLLLGAWLALPAQAQVGAEFDHSTTGYVISGPHNLVRCEQCHVNGVFKGTPRDCASCHGWNNPRSSVVKKTTHLPTTAPCESCHFSSASHFEDAVFTHVGVLPNTCNNCHGGQYPQIKAAPPDATHSAASNSGLTCDVCHTISTFAAPKPPLNHIPYAASASCQSCHVAADFAVMPDVGAIHANAQSTSSNCAQCHSSANAAYYSMASMVPPLKAPPTNHIGMGGQSCESCHVGASTSISSTPVAANSHFSGSKFSHTGISTGCADCHGPNVVPGNFYGVSAIVQMPSQAGPSASAHIPVNMPCETCHARAVPSGLLGVSSVPAIGATGFHNTPPLKDEIHTGINSGCSACHDTNAVWLGMALYPPVFNGGGGTYTGFQSRPISGGSTFAASDGSHPASGDCSQCHAGISFNLASVQKPANHIPVNPSSSCTNCHSADFSVMPSITNIHAYAPTPGSNCAQCHSSANAAQYAMPTMNPAIVVPPSDHISMGNLGCESCHVGANSSIQGSVQNGARFSNSAFSHSGISGSSSGGCSACHGTSAPTFYGVVPKNTSSLTPAHVPFSASLDCVTCHTNSLPTMLIPATGATGAMTTFAGGGFTHSGISTGCASCHGPNLSGSSFYGLSGMVLMPPTSPMGATSHIPTGTNCESCHVAPSGLVTSITPAPGSGFRTSPPSTVQIHAGISSGCSACHDTNYSWMSVASSYPISTSAPFTGFQTRPQAGGGTSFVADAGHPTTGDCSACHGSILDFTGVSKPANHIPVSAASQCTSCHVNPDYSVMPTLDSIHANAPNSSSACATCHSAANAAVYNQMASMQPQIVAPPGGHIDMGTLGCESCHVGANSSLMLPVQTGAKFNNSAFSHNGMNKTCADCHGSAVTATTFYGVSPKTIASLAPQHVPTTLACGTCHVNTPTSLVPASGGGSSANFANAKFIHTGISSGCATCHDNSITGSSFYGLPNIVVMPQTNTTDGNSHIPVSNVCENCHVAPAGFVTTIGSAPGSAFKNSPPSTVQIHAGITGGCATCHEAGYRWMGMSPAYNISTVAPYTGFQTRPQVTASIFSVADQGHPGSGDCSNCHGSILDFTGVSKPANHIPVSAASQCTSCHVSSDYSAMPARDAIHTYAPSQSTNCAQCHSAANAAYYALPTLSIVAPASNHIDMGGLGCESCHVASIPVGASTTFGNASFSHAGSGIAGNCAACHDASVTAGTFQGNNGSFRPVTNDLTPGHIPILAPVGCDTCHVGSVPPTLIPASGATGSMVSFANARYSHSGVTWGCANCHGDNVVANGSATGGTFYGIKSIIRAGMSSANPPVSGSTVHLPTSTSCESCHSSSIPAGTVPGNATNTPSSSGFGTPAPSTVQIHAGISGNCALCHEAGLNWMGMAQSYPISTTAPFTGFQTRPLPTAALFSVADQGHPGSGDCSNCHGSFLDFTGPSKPANHIPTGKTATCVSCHTNTDYSVMPTLVNIHANAPSTSTNCAQCHSAVAAQTYAMPTMSPALVGVPSDHMDMGTLGCESCHIATGSSVSLPVGNSAKFTNSGFSHTGISNGCSACHGSFNASGVAVASAGFNASGTTPRTIKSAAGLSPRHVPTTLDCSVCHTSVPNAVIPFASSAFSFAGGQFSHTSNPSTCASCHISGSSFAGPFFNTSVVQIAIPTAGTAASSSTHLPTTSTCETCHASAVPSALMAVSNVASVGSTAFRNQPPAASTIHSNTAGVCSNCHERAMVWAGMGLYPISTTAPFTGFQTRPTGTPVPTAFTYPDGSHPGSGECSSCHGSLTDFTATAKPANHIPTSAACTNCHTNADYSVMPQANWDLIHANAPTPGSNCAQCHSSTNASAYSNSVMTLKSVTGDHMSTGTLDCASCHTTSHSNGSYSSFGNASFSHAGLTVACSNCHSATAGTPITFSGTTPLTVTGIASNHVPTNTSGTAPDCGTACHSTPTTTIAYHSTAVTFAGGKFSHSASATNCAACHGSGSATSYVGVPYIARLASYATSSGSTSHIPLTNNIACENCHLGAMPSNPISMPSAPLVMGSTLFKLPAPTTTMIHNGITGDCANCHENQTWVDVNLYPPSSLGYTAGGTYTGFMNRPNSIGGSNTVQDQAHPLIGTGDCSKCHGSTQNFSITAKPANHIPTSASATCVSCHTQMGSTNDFSVFPLWADIHANAPTPTSNCAQCHSAANAATYAIPSVSFSIVAPGAGHIPLRGTTACEDCHVGPGSSFSSASPITNGVSSFGTAFGTPPSKYSHAGITSGCATCHLGTQSWTNIPGLMALPSNFASLTQSGSNHIPSSSTCESCHLTNTPTGQMTLPSGAVSPGSGTTGFKLALTAASNAAVHSGVTTCQNCHEKNYQWLGLSQAGYSPPTVTGTGSAAVYTGWLTRPYGGGSGSAINDGAHPGSGDCSQCHGGFASFAAAAQPAGHMQSSISTCGTCHLSAASGEYGTPTLAAPSVLHPGITATVTKLTAIAAVSNTSCVACHTTWTTGTANRAPFAGCTTAQASCPSPVLVNYLPKQTNGVAAHVPVGTLDCTGCHGSISTFASTTMGSTGHSNAKLGGLKCMACHEQGMAWTNVNNFQVRPGTTGSKAHTGSKAAPNDCAGCHSYSSGGFRSLVKPTLRSASVNPNIDRLRPTAANNLATRGMLGNNFDHKGVQAGQCKTCHDGKRASGLPARHLMSNASCDTCHRTSAWTPAQFSHNGIAPNSCMTCHNGVAASTRPAGHFMTARTCDSCHRTDAWTPVQYSHLSPAYQPGSAALTCTSCHLTNSEIIPRQMRATVRSKPTPLGP